MQQKTMIGLFGGAAVIAVVAVLAFQDGPAFLTPSPTPPPEQANDETSTTTPTPNTTQLPTSTGVR